jgi:D-aspartate ligase
MNNENKTSGGIIIGGHVQGLDIVRSLGENNIPAVVFDKDYNIASHSKYCKLFVKCPDYYTSDFADFLTKIGESNEFTGWVLYPTNDFAAYTISKYKEILSRYFKFTIPDFKIFNRFYSKKETIELCLKYDIPIPNTKYMHRTNNSLDYPFIVRGINGLVFFKTFGKKIFIIFNKEKYNEFVELLNKSGFECENVMIQEFIPFNKNRRGYYFTSFCVDGDLKTYFMWEKLREHPLKHGTSTWCKSVLVEELIEQSRIFLKYSGFTGVSEIEYLYDERDNTYKLIEVNARTFLQGSLARVSGVNYSMIIYNYLNNIEIECTDKYKTDIHWLHYWTDIFTGFWGVLTRELSLKEYVYPYVIKGKEMAVFDRNDIKPFLWETIMFPYIVYKRWGKEK